MKLPFHAYQFKKFLFHSGARRAPNWGAVHRLRMSVADRTTREPLDALVRAHYSGLSATEKRLADVVLAQRDAMLGYSATELAQLAGVSKASAARFFRHLGYADFNAVRTQLRAHAGAQAPLHRLAGRPARGGAGVRLQAHAAADSRTLERLPAANDAPALVQAVALLARAPQVAVVGLRNGHAVAFYAQSLLHQLRAGVRLLQDAAARDSELLADLGRGDALLAVDLRRRSRRLAPLLEAARAQGARVLLLTDSRVSELERAQDVVLRCPTHSGQLFDSHVAPLSLVNFLAAELAARSADAVRQRLERIEALHIALDDLEAPPDSNHRTLT